MDSVQQSKERQRIILLATLAAAFALRLTSVATQDIWWDEARNIDVALRPLFNIATAPELDIHPPLYFWLLHFWSRITGLELGLPAARIAYLTRFFSLTAGLVAVALLARLGWRLVPKFGGPMIGIVAAFSPFWLAESQETRMYTLGFALLIAAALPFLTIVQKVGTTKKEPGTCRHYLTFVLLSASALLTHYNAVFILVAWYGWWAWLCLRSQRRPMELRSLILCGLATMALIAPIAPIALRQIPGYANPNLNVPTIADYLIQNWRAYLGGYAHSYFPADPISTRWFLLIAAIVVIGWATTIPIYRRGSGEQTLRFQHRSLTFLWVWLLGGLSLYYIAVWDRGAFNVRYSSFVTPALYALVALSLLTLWLTVRVVALVGLVLLGAGFGMGIDADLTAEQAAREDISGVATWLKEVAGPDDVVFVDQKYPFGFYYQRYAIGDREPVGDEAAPARYLFVDINTIDAQLNQWASNAQNVYWVQWYESDTDPRRSVAFLLDKAGSRGGERQFRGYEVDWWTLSPPNQFELAQRYQEITIRWPSIRTVEIAAPENELTPGDTAFVVVRWQRSDLPADESPLKARVALYNQENARISQSDERILNDRHLLPAEWDADDSPLNVYRLTTAAELEPGNYEIRLLVYNADTLEPLSFLDKADNPAGVEIKIGEVEFVR